MERPFPGSEKEINNFKQLGEGKHILPKFLLLPYLKCKLPDNQIHLWNELKLGEKAEQIGYRT